jgi:cytidylate kinase
MFMMTAKTIIRELAEKEDCVIVGRCASYILRDLDRMFSTFIYADTEARVKRAVEVYGIEPRRAEAMLRKSDKRRETFYSINTGGNWYDKSNYDLCLNSNSLGIDLCADIIVQSVKRTLK